MGEGERPAVGYYLLQRDELLDLRAWEGGELVLDIGCGAGGNAPALRQHGAASVTGIEVVPEMANLAAKVYDSVLCGSVEKMLDRISIVPDVIIAGDVLEHLVAPDDVLMRLRERVHPRTDLLVSIPNVRHLSVLRMLALRGDWVYRDSGIMDRTHLRWFTRRSIESMLNATGWVIGDARPKFNTAKQTRWNRRSAGLAQEFLAEQWLLRCTPASD